MKISINETNHIANLGAVFSDRTKVLSELIQHARRAGANGIDIKVIERPEDKIVSLCIEDNGCGINNMHDLLTVVKSGWPESVDKPESPYCMEFISTLFTARKVLIQSNGYGLAINTKEALAGADIAEPFLDSGAPGRGTRIWLIGMSSTKLELEKTITALAE